MDMRKFDDEVSRSIDQYRPPMNYELAGKKFSLLMDDGYDWDLSFIDGTTLEWNIKGEAPARESYICMKGDETTYMMAFESAHTKLRTEYLFILDLENYLVTRQIATIGENPKLPYLTNTKFEFGVIDREGYEYTTYPRHGFTSDLTGNVVQWSYGSYMATVHVYHCSNFYRITYPLNRVSSSTDPNDAAAASTRAISEMLRSLPSRDEPTDYIKIKDGMYMISLTERNAEKILGDKIMFRSNNLTFLQNYKRVYQVGIGFGTSTLPSGERKTFLPFGAYGKLLDGEHENFKPLLVDPNPFLP